MLLFSPKAQQVIDEAMTLLDAPQRQLWLSWLAGRSELPGDDGSRAPCQPMSRAPFLPP